MEIIISDNGIDDAAGLAKYGPPGTEGTAICKRFLMQHFTTRKSTNKKLHSYRLKHLIEKESDHYVTNGELIQAAWDLGYKVERIRNGPNAYFNMEFRPGVKFRPLHEYI